MTDTAAVHGDGDLYGAHPGLKGPVVNHFYSVRRFHADPLEEQEEAGLFMGRGGSF